MKEPAIIWPAQRGDCGVRGPNCSWAPPGTTNQRKIRCDYCNRIACWACRTMRCVPYGKPDRNGRQDNHMAPVCILCQTRTGKGFHVDARQDRLTLERLGPFQLKVVQAERESRTTAREPLEDYLL